VVADEHDEVGLDLPASGPYARIARVAASALAMRLRVPPERLEDLRLAVDEAVVLLLSAAAEGDTIRARYRIDDDALAVELRLEPAGRVLDAPAVDRFEHLVADLTVTHTASAPESRVSISLSGRPG
jgi:anti-sigma regulatory factor (Ser/Thr protein kinase)